MDKITIVGFGLAGATFAWTCHFNKINFRIIQSGQESSSHVAAGLINPIVFKRLTKSWNADLLMPFAKSFYQKVETELGHTILSHKSILRVFASIEEQNNWSTLEGDARFSQFVSPAKLLEDKSIQAPFGVGEIKTLGHLNTRDFLNFSKSFFESKSIEFINEKSDYSAIKKLNKVVFCEGSDVLKNPFFSYLPMRPTHGDILTIKTTEFNLKDILNKNMFVLPVGKDLYKIGATYNWDLTNSAPFEAGKTELINRLRSFTNFDFEVIKHEAGLRPTVSDRRPVLGGHPEHENLYVFNGLGTKGVMIAPFYADHLLSHITNQSELDEEVAIKRHLKHYNA